ncbi:MAG: D-glycero-D-manno-heptose 1,7-bisphosphate phosphatase [Parcubacteria group bacterium Gr01-1014_38]|nr:MAG: D-glycero-D-manno-heptose 1,7-bisphosphate phosphatase [Parcubacteria group bacterium Gr01-1014_38]
MAKEEKMRVVFLDRDGTIIADRHSLHRIEQVDLLPGAVDGLRTLAGMGLALVVATNQSGVAHGKFTEDDVRKVHEYLRTIVAEQGVHFRAFLYCPHHPEGSVPEYALICECRKPASDMAKQAETFLGEIDYANSWSIGDKPTDVEFGQKLGMKTALIRSEYWTAPPDPKPDLIVNSLLEAAQKIRTRAT